MQVRSAGVWIRASSGGLPKSVQEGDRAKKKTELHSALEVIHPISTNKNDNMHTVAFGTAIFVPSNTTIPRPAL